MVSVTVGNCKETYIGCNRVGSAQTWPPSRSLALACAGTISRCRSLIMPSMIPHDGSQNLFKLSQRQDQFSISAEELVIASCVTVLRDKSNLRSRIRTYKDPPHFTDASYLRLPRMLTVNHQVQLRVIYDYGDIRTAVHTPVHNRK